MAGSGGGNLGRLEELKVENGCQGCLAASGPSIGGEVARPLGGAGVPGKPGGFGPRIGADPFLPALRRAG